VCALINAFIRSNEVDSRDWLQPRTGPGFGEEFSGYAKTTRQYLRDLSQHQKGTGKIGTGNVQPETKRFVVFII